MPAPQLPDDEVEAKYSGPCRVQEVLPLVRHAHPAQGDALVAREADLGRGAPPAVRPAGEVQQGRRTGVIGFVGESWAELKKVEWPKQNQVIQGTVVVLVACVIVGAYLWANDLVWKHFVQSVLLK
jgi:preprotein translocase subunit SecE